MSKKVNFIYYLNTKAKPKKAWGDTIEYHFPLLVRLNYGTLRAGFNYKSIYGNDVVLTESAFKKAFTKGKIQDKTLAQDLRIIQHEEILAKILNNRVSGIEYKFKDLVKGHRSESRYLSPSIDKLLIKALKDLSRPSMIDRDHYVSDINGDIIVDSYKVSKSFINESDWDEFSNSTALGVLGEIRDVLDASLALNFYLNKVVLKSKKPIGTLYSFSNTSEKTDLLDFLEKLDNKTLSNYFKSYWKVQLPGLAFIIANRFGCSYEPKKADNYISIIESLVYDHLSNPFQ